MKVCGETPVTEDLRENGSGANTTDGHLFWKVSDETAAWTNPGARSNKDELMMF